MNTIAPGGWSKEVRGFLLWHGREIEHWLDQPIEIIG
jgi:hypothetical protein